MTYTYVPGRGYTVRDSRGILLGHSLTVAQRDALLSCKGAGVLSAALLATLAS